MMHLAARFSLNAVKIFLLSDLPTARHAGFEVLNKVLILCLSMKFHQLTF